MTDINTTVERIKSANAVPSTDSFPSGAWSSADLLVRIDERNKTMTETLTPVRQIDPSKPPRRGRGPLVALAVAAALILILGVVGFNVLTGDSQPDVIEPPPTTVAPTTTTVAQPTTLAPEALPSPLPADTTPLEMINVLAARWNAGDIEGGWELFHPDTDEFLSEARAGIDAELYYRYATRMTTSRECEVRTPPELADLEPRVAGAQIVACVDTIASGLDPEGFKAGGVWAISVADGWVHDFWIIDFRGALSETDGLNAYRDWMQVQRFNEGGFEELFDQTSFAINVDTAEAREMHRNLIPAFLGDTGPRGELALSPDTPFDEVVRVFHERWDAGDVEAWAALFHPGNNYSPDGDAPASWFIEVTGATVERECETITSETLATQVRCIERTISGLAPGVVGEDTVVVYTGDVGWIWGIDFPNGGPPTISDMTNAAGVAEYTAWVQDNRPAEFAALFSGGILMRLDTEEVRNLHKTTIAEYLAATS